MASFQQYKTKAGMRWMFKFYGEIDPRTGKRRPSTRRGFKTKREAQRVAAIIESKVEMGLSVNDNPITFKEFSEKWERIYKEEKDVKPATIRIQKFQLNILLRYFKNIRMVDITLNQYLDALRDLNDNYSENTVRGIHATAKMLFRKAMQLEVLTKDPTEYSYIPKVKKTLKDKEEEISLPQYLEKEDLGFFLEVSQREGLELDFPIFLTLAYSGLRVGELCVLKECDLTISDDRYFIDINKTYFSSDHTISGYEVVSPKTKSSRRKIEIEKVVYDALVVIIERNRKLKIEFGDDYYDEGFIFADSENHPGYPFPPYLISHRMQRLLKLSELGLHLSPHSLRHTHTSLLSEAGVSLERIMERLGHSSDEVTKQIYLHTTDAVRKKDSEKFGNLMKNVVDFSKYGQNEVTD